MVVTTMIIYNKNQWHPHAGRSSIPVKKSTLMIVPHITPSLSSPFPTNNTHWKPSPPPRPHPRFSPPSSPPSRHLSLHNLQEPQCRSPPINCAHPCRERGCVRNNAALDHLVQQRQRQARLSAHHAGMHGRPVHHGVRSNSSRRHLV